MLIIAFIENLVKPSRRRPVRSGRSRTGADRALSSEIIDNGVKRRIEKVGHVAPSLCRFVVGCPLLEFGKIGERLTGRNQGGQSGLSLEFGDLCLIYVGAVLRYIEQLFKIVCEVGCLRASASLIVPFCPFIRCSFRLIVCPLSHICGCLSSYIGKRRFIACGSIPSRVLVGFR